MKICERCGHRNYTKSTTHWQCEHCSADLEKQKSKRYAGYVPEITEPKPLHDEERLEIEC